ncbi:MAG: hypothetical protein HXS44_10625 [Theionarchaea archaeon]|nr:hypothetical protein [Theionarchaea archaeon]
MKRIWIILVLLCSLQVVQSEEYAVLTIKVQDVYGSLIDDAVVTVDYIYTQADDTDIPDQFTKKGVAQFNLEAQREYIIAVTKAGFIPYTERVELEEDTTITVTLQYAKTAPVLHAQKYTITPQEVAPGESFRLHLVIENEGTGDALAVRVTFVPAQFFSPTQPSSSAYFDRLDVGKIASIFQTFAVSGEAVSGVYDLALAITYSDATGLSYTVQETVGIPILRKPLVKLLNVEYLEEVEQGEVFNFSVEIVNTGRFAVNGLYLEIESDMEWEFYSYYVGSLEAGDFDTFESEVMAEEPGEHTFIIRVGFIDDFNREHSQEESFSLSVKEKVRETPPPQEEKGLWQRFIEFLKAFLGLG